MFHFTHFLMFFPMVQPILTRYDAKISRFFVITEKYIDRELSSCY